MVTAIWTVTIMDAKVAAPIAGMTTIDRYTMVAPRNPPKRRYAGALNSEPKCFMLPSGRLIRKRMARPNKLFKTAEFLGFAILPNAEFMGD